MLKNKVYIYFLMFIKYIVILQFSPELEVERFYQFFDSCSGFCVDPFKNIYSFESTTLSFPYGYVMYIFLIPFFKIANFLNISFVIFSYIVVEVLAINILKNFYDVDERSLLLPFILNPIIVYSVVAKGYLDFIPLLFFILSLSSFKNRKFDAALFFLCLGIGSKVILILILPLLITYIHKNLDDVNKTIVLSIRSFVYISIFYGPILFNEFYYASVISGIREGSKVLQYSGIFNLNTLIISQTIIFITYYFFWKNIKKMDYFGLVVCLGICTFPLFILNFSNLGWFLWSIPAIVYVFISLENSRRYLIYLYFICVVIVEIEIFTIALNENLIALQFFFSLIIIRYFYQFLTQNKYYRIKSQPVVIAIAGDSGVGKSTISGILTDFLGKQNTTTIETDNYHKYERNSKIWDTKTHLDPLVNQLGLFKKQLIEIISGNVEKIKEYNHLTGKFDEIKHLKVNDFILVEGLHTLMMRDLNELFNLKVYIDLDKKLKDDFKFARDIERNKTPDEINAQIESRTEDFINYIEPQQANADISVITKSINDGSVTIKLKFSTEYLEEFLDILRNNNVEILSHDYDGANAEVVLLSEIDNYNLIETCSNRLKNIKNYSFEFVSDEMNIKSSIIIYFLAKKLELI